MDRAKQWLQILAEGAPEDWAKPRLITYRDGSRDRDASRIIEILERGEAVALISDAGTPAISDPGWHLVSLVRERGLPIFSLPGPCAATTALAASGFPSRRFRFEGFLPTSGRQRREALERLVSSTEPTVLYESPHHFESTLKDLATKLPDRELYVSREMTKRFEEDWRGPVLDALEAWQERTIKGEFTLVLSGSDPVEKAASSVPSETLDFLRELDLPTKMATAIALHFYPRATKRDVYSELRRKAPTRPESS